MTRGDWWEIRRVLDAACIDLECKRWLEERKAMSRLSVRIETFIDSLPADEPEPLPVPAKVKQMALF